MLQDEKILVTGPAGQIAFPLAKRLAQDNEVWGIARFSNPSDRSKVEAAGITVRVCDLGQGRLSEVPTDFTIVLHLATYRSPRALFDAALKVNAEGTGLLLQHCRNARAALVMSAAGIYKPHGDPWHAYIESDPLGDAVVTYNPTYTLSKITQEAVARYCARAFDLPVVLARMNASYGPTGGLPATHLDAIVAGEPVVVRWDPCPYSPIHDDDIFGQLEPLLSVASVPATVVNWGGDEPVAAQAWCAFLGELSGLEARVEVGLVPGGLLGCVTDTAKRARVTGPCTVSWREGMRRMLEERHPDRSLSR